MSDKVATLFQQYGSVKDAPLYRAYELDKTRNHQVRLRIHYPDGSVGALPYAHLLEVISTSHQYLALFYTNLILSIEGRNLTGLVELLQDEKIRALYCFHPERFAEPVVEDPVIYKIIREEPHGLARGA